MYWNWKNRALQGQDLISPFWGCQLTGCTNTSSTPTTERRWSIIDITYTNYQSHLAWESDGNRVRYRIFASCWAGRGTTSLVLHIGWMECLDSWTQCSTIVPYREPILGFAIIPVLHECSPVAFLTFSHSASSPLFTSYSLCPEAQF